MTGIYFEVKLHSNGYTKTWVSQCLILRVSFSNRLESKKWCGWPQQLCTLFSYWLVHGQKNRALLVKHVYVCVMVCIWCSLHIFYSINESKTTSRTLSLTQNLLSKRISFVYNRVFIVHKNCFKFFIIGYFVSPVKEQEIFLFCLKYISSSMLKNVVYSFI